MHAKRTFCKASAASAMEEAGRHEGEAQVKMPAEKAPGVPISPVRAALEGSAKDLIGVGQLASQMTHACLPLPKPFGLHMRRGGKVHETLKGCVVEAKKDLWTSMSSISSLSSISDFCDPDDSILTHCNYAVQYEFPWLPFLTGLKHEPEIKEAFADAIINKVSMGFGDQKMARRWWYMYEQVLEPLPIDDVTDMDHTIIPLLPPERFFTTQGFISPRHGILDNLLGDASTFCPFVEKFAGASDAAREFKAELLEVLSPICMMTIKDFFSACELTDSTKITQENLGKLLQHLDEDGFSMSEEEKQEFYHLFGVGGEAGSKGPDDEGLKPLSMHIVNFAEWLRGAGRLPSRLREHLLGASPRDLRWHAPGEHFMERLSRVISSIETRASQMIENELPPERKERYFVDAISKPWERDVEIDKDLIMNLQRGLMEEAKYLKCLKTQVEGQPYRNTQNWVSSEKYDDMVGKVKVLHHLPPPPECLPELIDGYFKCLNRMLSDPTIDPIVCATITKVALNVLHPLVDCNGRVQRLLFQLVLFKLQFLPRMNVPVSVIMLQDRTGYEVLQQRHVDQTMAGIAYEEGNTDVDEGGDDFRHLADPEHVIALYKYQDFTWAVSSMSKLMQSTLPVIAAKAYFLQRFDWRVDELLKGDALLPPKAATKIAKVFKNDGHGFSMLKLGRLLFLDGWEIGFKRILRFLMMAKHPTDIFAPKKIMNKVQDSWKRSRRQLWVMRTGQIASASSTGRVRWVGVSLQKFDSSGVALRRALRSSSPGDTVMAVHYPSDLAGHFSMDLFPDMASDIQGEMVRVRKALMDKVDDVVAEAKVQEKGVQFRTFIGPASEYKPAHALCEDAKVAEAPPYRIYVGYDNDEHHRTFTDYVVRNAPCDVAIIKGDFHFTSSTKLVRWVGISERNFDVSGAALAKAFYHSLPGDTVVAVHYPVNPFSGEWGMSSVFCDHFSSLAEKHLDVIMDDTESRVMESARRIADQHRKEGVHFEVRTGMRTEEPHKRLVLDAKTSAQRPDSIYVGYNRRRDVNRLVDPDKLYDVAGFVVRNAPCNVVVIKETQTEMVERVKNRKEIG